MLLKLFKLRIR